MEIFLIKSESFPSIGSNATYTFKAQNGGKDIVKVLHVNSVSGLTSNLLRDACALFAQ